MATFTLNRPDLYPAGTSVGAYPESNWPNGVDSSAAPLGSPTNTQTASATGLTFTGLTQGQTYVAHATVGGQQRYIGFIAGADVAGSAGFPATLDTDPALAADSDTRVASQKATKTFAESLIESGAPDASTTVKGISTLSTAPASASDPIAVGDNDPRNTNARAPTAHATTHQPGGSDAMAVDAAAATGSLRTLGTGATQAAAGNDARLAIPSDAELTAIAGLTSAADRGIHFTGSGAAALHTLTQAGRDILDDADPAAQRATLGAAAAVHTHAASDVTSGTFADARLASPNNASYKPVVHWRSGQVLDSNTAGTYLIADTAAGVVGTAGASAGGAVFYLDPADFTVAGLTTKYLVKAVCLTNTITPVCTFVLGLYPITACAGAANANAVTVDTVVSGSTVTFTTPAASERNQGNSGDFTAPAAGYYALGVATSATLASTARIALSVTLLRRNT